MGHICATLLVSQTKAIFAPHFWFHRHGPYLRHPTGVTDKGHICATLLVSQTWAIFAPSNWCHRPRLYLHHPNWCHSHRTYLSHPTGVTDIEHICATHRLSQTWVIFAPKTGFTDIVHKCAKLLVSQTWTIFAPPNWCHRHSTYLHQTCGVTDMVHISATQLVCSSKRTLI